MNFEERLDPELKNAVQWMPENPDLNSDNVREMRQIVETMLKAIALPTNEAVNVFDRFIPGPAGAPDVRVRIYEPKQKGINLPGLMMLHGGGFVVGTAEMHEAFCLQIVAEINCVLVSVDYRLAPENPFPAAIEDCYAALKWFAESARELGINPARIAVMGGSSGGGLTAALTLLTRDRKGPAICFQMPLYPMIDDRCLTQSNREMQDKRVSNGSAIRAMWKMYLGENNGDLSSYAAPSRAADFSGLPPTYTCVGELDPFRDETIEYVAKLTKAGVPVEFHLYPGCFHGFEVLANEAEISKKAYAEYIAALKKALRSK